MTPGTAREAAQGASRGAVPAGWRAVPLRARVDLAHGGRWTSLAAPGREWLWHHPDPAVRAARAVATGPAFVDAGGGEECLPTVDGAPDHGAVWPLPWVPDGEGDASVSADGLVLRRRLSTRLDGAVRADYAVRGAPGRAVLHAVHLLLDLSPAARVQLPQRGLPAQVREEHGGGAPRRWSTSWPPVVAGRGADRLGPDDGTAAAVLVPGCHGALVVDGDDALQLTWRAGGDRPTSLLLWRNLRGWPAAGPYRSTGLEPLLGAATDLADVERAAGAGGAHLDERGDASWWLELRALRRTASEDRPGGSARTSFSGRRCAT